MLTNRFVFLLIVVAVVIATACAPQVPATTNPTSAPVVTPVQDKPVTLRFAVADAQDNPSGPYALEFIQQVKTLSNGNITIEPVWKAGDSTEAGFEIGVIQLVKKGDMDVGLAASRAFDNENITSFQALQAPFLITDDNLAKAVATSDIGTKMLDDLKSSGLVGLTLWPEDLRHPFSLVPGRPLLSPQDFAGLNIRTTPSVASNKLVEALGGKPMYADSDYEGAESGLRQGYSLTGTPVATGNVTFFAKYQVLFGNDAAFEKLSETQRAILREAAKAAQTKAIAEHPSETDAATAWCADGGAIALASQQQVAMFETAAQPVIDSITQDPFNAQSVAAIRELKTKTTSSSGAQACVPTAQANPQPTTGPEAWSKDLPPNGTWQAHVTADDFVRMGVLKSVAESDWAGLYTVTFKDGKFLNVWQGEQGQSGKCQANYELVGDVVRLTYYQTTGDECVNEVDDIQWRLDDQGLYLHLVDVQNAQPTEIKAYYEAKPWQNVEEWSKDLLPNGVWQVKLSPEDLMAVGGIMQSTANEQAGTQTFTFKDGNFKWTLEGDSPGYCEGTYALVGDVNRLTLSGDCAPEVDDVQWRLDDEGLHLHLANIQHASFAAIKANLEAKPYQKVADQ